MSLLVPEPMRPGQAPGTGELGTQNTSEACVKTAQAELEGKGVKSLGAELRAEGKRGEGKKELKLCKRGLILFNRRRGNAAQSRAQQPQPLGQQYKHVCLPSPGQEGHANHAGPWGMGIATLGTGAPGAGKEVQPLPQVVKRISLQL